MAMSFGDALQNANAYYSGKTRDFMRVALPAASIMVFGQLGAELYFALLETEYIPKYGSQEAKNLAKVSAMYKNLSYLLKNADLGHISKMFSSMPVDVMEHFTDSVELTSQELSAYLDEHRLVASPSEIELGVIEQKEEDEKE